MRLISESEIGYAVLYCSTQNYCNPTIDKCNISVQWVFTISLKIGSQLPAQLPTPSLSCSLLYTQTSQSSDATVLAYNTEEPHSIGTRTHPQELPHSIGINAVDETIIKGEEVVLYILLLTYSIYR